MRAAVVGHVEWVTFLRVDRAIRSGVIAHASDAWDEAAGGGGVAAVELARLAGGSTLYTAVGDDDAGRAVAPALERHGVRVRAAVRPLPHRKAVTTIDPDGERTIVVVGPAQAPVATDGWSLGELDVAYFCKGDAGMVRAARAARVLVATARELATLDEARVPLDVLVHSGSDPGERYADGDLDPAPAVVVTTEGGAGGRWRAADGGEGRWPAAPLPGPVEDAYGAGDCFAASLGFALAEGRALPAALDFAAGRAAVALCRRGAHGGWATP